MSEFNVKKYKTRKRLEAIQLVKAWADFKLKGYDEPERKGTPKGDPIGFSRKKIHAACLDALYPGCFKLKEIAKIADISEGVYRVWRTQKEFKKVAMESNKSLGQRISDKIESIMHSEEIESMWDSAKRTERELRENSGNGEVTPISRISNNTLHLLKSQERYAEIIKAKSKVKIENIIVLDDLTKPSELPEQFKKNPIDFIYELIGLLPFLDISVGEPFIESLRKNLDDGFYRYASLGIFMFRDLEVHDQASLLKWQRGPLMLRVIKDQIESDINYLINPEVKKQLTEEEIKNHAEQSIRFVHKVIDMLSK